jgi:type II secretory pathway pseudopilin PulG
MTTFKKIANWIRDSKGVATSLIEATATIAVGAVLAGVAVGGAIDAINNSKVQAAIGDVSTIGQGMITFYKDNDFFPLFADGSKTGGGDSFFGFLVSENGTFPTDSTTATDKWSVVSDTTPWDGTIGFFGIKPDYTAATNGTGADSIEGDLIRNLLGNGAASSTNPHYPLRGTYTGDPNRGWSGPYVTSLPKTDPWGDKYIVNIRNLHSGYLTSIQTTYSTCTSGSALPSLAVFVLSAGPNRTIETPVNQCFNTFSALGDDIVFRIK